MKIKRKIAAKEARCSITHKLSCKFPCVVFRRAVRSDSKAIAYDICEEWFHVKSIGISNERYDLVKKQEQSLDWTCEPCSVVVFPAGDQSMLPDELPTLPDFESARIPDADVSGIMTNKCQGLKMLGQHIKVIARN